MRSWPADRIAFGGDYNPGRVTPVAEVAPGVEAVRRRHGDRSWLFLANHTEQPQTVSARGHDLVSDRAGDTVQLQPGDVAVVREG